MENLKSELGKRFPTVTMGNFTDNYREFANARRIFVGKYKNSTIIIGDFTSFLSGKMYFGKILDVGWGNGNLQGEYGSVGIILYRSDKVNLVGIAPKSFTLVEEKEMPRDSDLELLLQTAFNFQESLKYEIGSRHDFSHNCSTIPVWLKLN